MAPLFAEETKKSADTNRRASLLRLDCDFADSRYGRWRPKGNAELSIAEDDGNPALRLTSSFAPFSFTWTTWFFEPHAADDVVHVTYRVFGDGSGHTLQLQLGAPRSDGKGSLYYVNAK